MQAYYNFEIYIRIYILHNKIMLDLYIETIDMCIIVHLLTWSLMLMKLQSDLEEKLLNVNIFNIMLQLCRLK